MKHAVARRRWSLFVSDAGWKTGRRPMLLEAGNRGGPYASPMFSRAARVFRSDVLEHLVCAVL